MKLSPQKLEMFTSMIKEFAIKNGLNVDLETTSYNTEITHIYFSRGYRRKNYDVHWNRVMDLADASSGIINDVLRYFEMKDTNKVVSQFDISRVIFKDPATIVFWTDGTKTIVKCQKGDLYSQETGLALCIAKKALGNSGNFNNTFKKWLPEEPTKEE